MITQGEVRRIFKLDENTGDLIWKVKTGKKVIAGTPAGYLTRENRIVIKVLGQLYYRNRLVFLYVNGFLPEEVDHINGIKSDDRPINLREATRSQNEMNKPRRTGNAFPKGVSRSSSKEVRFRARIHKDGSEISLGCFATIEEASDAYNNASNAIHGEFSRPDTQSLC